MDPVIALVENDLPTNRAIARLLRISGYTIESYASAEQFLECLALGTPDCVIVDVDLDGMSGVDLQAALPRRGVDLPVIVITGRCDSELFSRAHALGCSSFLHKPVSLHPLLDAIAKALAKRPFSPAH